MTAVLLNVDDHESARYARSRILSSAGFSVHDASNGEETLALAEKHHPDLILLDLHLPDVNGIEVPSETKSSGFSRDDPADFGLSSLGCACKRSSRCRS